MSKQNGVESKVGEMRRKTRKRYSVAEKIRIVLEGLRGKECIFALYRREEIATNLYYSWSKEFMVAGKRRLMGDIKWQGANSEVLFLRKENSQLRKLVVILSLTNVVLKEAWLEQAQVGKIQSRDSCISQGRLPSIVNFWSIISDRSFKCEVKVSKLGLGTSFYLDTCRVR